MLNRRLAGDIVEAATGVIRPRRSARKTRAMPGEHARTRGRTRCCVPPVFSPYSRHIVPNRTGREPSELDKSPTVVQGTNSPTVRKTYTIN